MDKGIKTYGSRRVVTAEECLTKFIGGIVFLLLLTLGGLWVFSPNFFQPFSFQAFLKNRDAVLFALLLGFEATRSGDKLAKQWKRYTVVRSGVAVYTSDSESNPVATMLCLTATVAVWTYFNAWLIQQKSVGLWSLVIIASDVVFWTFTVFCWYWLLFRRPKAVAPAEPQEGVWPPPPIRSNDPQP